MEKDLGMKGSNNNSSSKQSTESTSFAGSNVFSSSLTTPYTGNGGIVYPVDIIIKDEYVLVGFQKKNLNASNVNLKFLKESNKIIVQTRILP